MLQPGFSFSDVEVWKVFMTFAVIMLALLLSAILRNQSSAVRKTLIPVPVIAGFLILILEYIWKLIFKTELLNREMLEVLTYHCLGLGFCANALKISQKTKDKKAKRDIFNASLVTASSYLLQAVVGLAVSLILFFAIGSWFGAGVILPMGFGQGPGQAYNWGNIYEQGYNFTNGATFGLTIGAAGFVTCSIGGVIYLNKMRKAGKINPDTGAASIRADEESIKCDAKEIAMSDSVDKLTIQFALVFVAYAITYGFMTLISMLCKSSGVKILAETVNNLIWGFNFIWATIAAVLVRNIFVKAEERGHLKNKYINNDMLDRVSGIAFDLMVTAALAAINLSAFKQKEFIIPLILMCVLGLIFTYIYVDKVSKKLFPKYSDEAFLSLFGMLTGTASTGVILLREIDPHFKTPALKNLVFQALWTVLLGAPLLLLMGQVPLSLKWCLICFGIFLAMFIVFFVWILLASRKVQKDNLDK